uniref:Uncharacterized protein n=1 Tax=Cannabis sativa TaxID=3483 RepID=A0A803PTH5_CANSA
MYISAIADLGRSLMAIRLLIRFCERIYGGGHENPLQAPPDLDQGFAKMEVRIQKLEEESVWEIWMQGPLVILGDLDVMNASRAKSTVDFVQESLETSVVGGVTAPLTLNLGRGGPGSLDNQKRKASSNQWAQDRERGFIGN